MPDAPTPAADDGARRRNETPSTSNSLLAFTQAVVPLVIAVAVLYIFWTLVKTMMGMTKAPDLEWSRAAYLFSGVEAIAYAAAGFLFGREVHRQRAEQAEQRAGSEQKRASAAENKATEETTKGKVLKQVIEAKKSTARERGADTDNYESLSAGGPPADGQTDIEELSRVANQLFP